MRHPASAGGAMGGHGCKKGWRSANGHVRMIQMTLAVPCGRGQVRSMPECFLEKSLVRRDVGPVAMNFDALENLACISLWLISWINAASRMVRETGYHLNVM